MTRTAIVTGASRGIGRAVALRLGAAGTRIAAMARDRDALGSLADEILACGGPAPHLEAFDIRVADDLEQAARRSIEFLDGRVGFLANVAGAASRRKRLEDLDDDDWAAEFDLNLMAPIRLSRHCFEALRDGGTIVNVSSIVAGRASPTGGPYAAAKAGLESFTRTTALEWARHGIRAVTVAPGYVDTDFNAGAVESGYDDRFLKGVPTRRMIDAGEVAHLIVALADPEYPNLTGTVVTLDGGRTTTV